MSGTGISVCQWLYTSARRCPVLRSRMLLPGCALLHPVFHRGFPPAEVCSYALATTCPVPA
eukprot:1432554-Rhodomonas_salina.2